MKCQLKKGIFRQRNCNATTDTKCSSCEIYVCLKHQIKIDDKILCNNCFTKENELKTDDGYNSYMKSDGGFYLWYWILRQDFDNEYGLEPFDESDFSGFENVDVDSYDEAEFNEDDFLDS